MYQLHSLNQKRNCLRICIQSEAAELHSAVRSSLSLERQKTIRSQKQTVNSILEFSKNMLCAHPRISELHSCPQVAGAHISSEDFIFESHDLHPPPLREERTWSKTIDTSLLSYCTSKYINSLKFIPLSYVGLMPTSTIFLLNLISKCPSLSIDI